MMYRTLLALFLLLPLQGHAATQADVKSNVISADVSAGRTVFVNQCSGCHSNMPHMDRFGPTLAGVYGRESGTAPLHRYSAAMKSAHIIWNRDNLDGFLKNPRGYVRGTTMPYSGLASAVARADVIAYLRSISPKSGA